MLILVLAVIGGIYGGVFTVNEAAAVGAALSFLFALARRRLTWMSFWRALIDTASNTAMIYVIIFGASIFSYFINVSHVPEAMTAWVQALPLPPLAIIFVLLVIYVILGCIFDTVSAMLITLPFVLPIVTGLGYDPIWWGIINVVVVELGMITPPIGINVFVLYGVARTIPLVADLPRRHAVRRVRFLAADAADPGAGADALAAARSSTCDGAPAQPRASTVTTVAASSTP